MKKKRTVIVTGAGGGFGKGIVEAFLAEGDVVYGLDIDTSKLDALEEEWAEGDLLFHALTLDISKVENFDTIIAEILETEGQIDVLVNCAGICSGTPILEMSESEWDRTYDINVKGLFFLSQKIAAHMIQKDHSDGRIINISSLVSFTGGILSSAAYSSSKSAVTCTTKNFAKFLAPYGITVNEIAPGTGKTDLASQFIGDRFEEFVKKTPLGRLCNPEDVGKTALFLASDAASYITGQTVHVNGGMYM